MCAAGSACVNGACTTGTTPGRFTLDAYVATDTANANQLWQRAYAGPMTWAQAGAYCAALNLDGKTGWTLPLHTQLQTLVLKPSGLQSPNPPYCAPADDHVAFPSDIGSGSPGSFWCGDPIGTGAPDSVDTIDFTYGRTFPDDPTDSTNVLVRCTHAPI